MTSWFDAKDNGEIIVAIYAQPGAKNSELCGLHDGLLKVKLAAKPVDGEANEELLSFLRKQLSIKNNQITLRSGEKARKKLVAIVGVTKEFVCKQLLPEK